VVIVRQSEQSDDKTDAPVVVGVDESAASQAALDFAFGAAESRRAPLIAVHAYDRLLDGAPMPLPNLYAVQAREEQLLVERLAGWLERYPTVAVERVVERERAVTLLTHQAKGARLLVLGTNGRGGVVGDLLGSVSQALLHRAECPVAVVPPHSRTGRI
jgi:nucleotide-binding universal stress UspA family protein